MRRLLVISALVLALVGLLAFSAQAHFTLIFDEWGNGIIQIHDGETYTVAGKLGNSPEGYANALSYALPETVGTGFVPIWEPKVDSVVSDKVLSDVLRFEPTVMWFYSDPAEPDEKNPPPAELSEADWADLLKNYSAVFQDHDVFERDPDGRFLYDTGTNIYIGYSDAPIPLPPSALLLGSGLLGLVSWRKFRKG